MVGDKALQHLRRSTRLSLALNRLDGRAAAAVLYRGARVGPDFLLYLRKNRDLASAHGRYAGDVYDSGGAYYFSTLGSAEFCFAAAAPGGDARHWFAAAACQAPRRR